MNELKRCCALLFAIFIFSKPCVADIIIKYVVEKDAAHRSRNSVSDYILDIVKNSKDIIDLDSKKRLPREVKILSNKQDREIFIINYKINGSGIFYLTDLLGHEILLDQSMDGDTIELRLNVPDKAHLLNLNDSVKRTWYYDIVYPEKYSYMGFFDKLAYLHGALGRIGGGYTFKELNQNIAKYLEKVNKVYADRISFYNDFIKIHSMPKQLQRYVFKEIQYSYYDDMTDPLVVWDGKLIQNYPLAMRDTIDKIGQHLGNDELFENTTFYRRMALNYMYLTGFQGGPITSSRDQLDSTFVLNRTNFCKKNMSGLTRNYLLAYLMRLASRHNFPPTFSELYKNYDHYKSTPGTNRLVDSLYATINHAGNISEEELLILSFEDAAHHRSKLKDVFNKDIVLIDCWATWCIPCIEQMPALNELINKFKDRVQFVAISADQFLPKWDNWITNKHNADKLIVQLHAQNGFQHEFFSRLLINAIPRYLLISKSGKILNMAMPYPSEKEKFETELKKYL